MNSSLIIRAEPLERNGGLSEMMDCMASITAMARLVSGPVRITMQHNIRDDHFSIMAETEDRTFGHAGKNFKTVFKNLRKEVERYTDKELHSEKLLPAKKQAAREESRQRRGGKGSGG